MTKENLEIIITNGYCCSTKKAVELSKLLSLGSNCTDKKEFELLILNNALNILKCYNFNGTPSLLSVILYGTSYATLSSTLCDAAATYYLTVNDITYTTPGELGKTEEYLFLKLLDMSSKLVSYELIEVGPDLYWNIKMSCDTTMLIIGTQTNLGTSVINFDLISKGDCTINNCLTEEELNKLTHTVMNICDICDCQLKQ